MKEKIFEEILTQKIKDNIKKLDPLYLEQQDKIAVILQALSNIDQEFPRIGVLKEIIVSSFLAIIPKESKTKLEELEAELEKLCSQLIGEDRKDKTLLHYAVEYRKNALVQKLLEAGFKDSSYSKFRNSAFNVAVEAFIKSSPLLLVQSQ